MAINHHCKSNENKYRNQVFLFAANQEDFMADAGVLSPTEFAKRMLNKDERKDTIRNIKENVKGSLNEIRHEVKDTVKVVYTKVTNPTKF